PGCGAHRRRGGRGDAGEDPVHRRQARPAAGSAAACDHGTGECLHRCGRSTRAGDRGVRNRVDHFGDTGADLGADPVGGAQHSGRGRLRQERRLAADGRGRPRRASPRRGRSGTAGNEGRSRRAGVRDGVVAWSQNLDAERTRGLGVRAVSKDELLSTSDVLTIHYKLSDRSRGLISTAELEMMKPNAVLVNTSRAGLVDTDALIASLEAGRIRGAGLDVHDLEPLPVDHRLRSTPRTVLTPHLGYVTEDTYRIFFTQAVENIAAWAKGQPIRVLG